MISKEFLYFFWGCNCYSVLIQSVNSELQSSERKVFKLMNYWNYKETVFNKDKTNIIKIIFLLSAWLKKSSNTNTFLHFLCLIENWYHITSFQTSSWAEVHKWIFCKSQSPTNWSQSMYCLRHPRKYQNPLASYQMLHFAFFITLESPSNII